MSYILDALKKLENERQKKSRSDGMVSISGELFKDEPRQKSARSIWKIAALVIAASLITFGTTWFLLRPVKTRDSGKSRPVTTAVPAARVSPPVPASPSPPLQPPVAAPQPSAVVPPTPPAQPAQPAPASQPLAAEPAASNARKVAPAVVAQRRVKRHKNSEAREERLERVEKPAPVYGEAPADIKVSGIAWQEERSARRVVVNGFLFREGGTVSGARITEILKDRVRFSSGEKLFEVHLNVPGLSEAGK